VDEDPVVVATARGQRAQRIANGFRARRAAAGERLDARTCTDDLREALVIGRQRDDDRIGVDRGKPRERAREQRLAAEVGVLLGRAESRAAPRGRDDDPPARHRGGRHGRSSSC
jgi:hypothetical protein